MDVFTSVRLSRPGPERHPDPDPAAGYSAVMTEESVDTPEADGCRTCEIGRGHEVDITDSANGYQCSFRCRVCRTAHLIGSEDDLECCGHRYVGEDLFRAEDYFDMWECPGCDGSDGEHETDCEFR